MKAYVITMQDNERSCEAAKRCIETAKASNIDVEMYRAFTPVRDDVYSILESEKIDYELFTEVYSRQPEAIACFLSHYGLWKKSLEIDQELLILEHDAVFIGDIPKNVPYDYIINYGKPSYGKYLIPPHMGVNPLTSKQYMPGAHAYSVTTLGAKYLIDKAKTHAGPTDIFMNNKNFPDMIKEYYPWPVIADDSFTTIQKVRGCLAKHNYKEGEYDII